MIPREIHSPEVLEAIEKECKFMAGRALGQAGRTAYNQMAISARQLRTVILTGKLPKAKCSVCGWEFSINNHGNMRSHRSPYGSTWTQCVGSGKPPKAESAMQAPAVDKSAASS